MALDFNFDLRSESDKFEMFEFIAFGKALKEAVEAMVDGSDAVHDYVQEILPADIEVHRFEVGEVNVKSIGGPGGE
jgi:hypothetical protein